MYKFHYLLPCLFLLVVFSCDGQKQPNARNQLNISENQSTTKEFKDPLFYIDGQLCQHLREIFQDSKGNLFFGTNNYGLMYYNGDSLTYFTEKEGMEKGRITGIVEDKAGNIWIGNYGGLTKFDGASFTDFGEKDGLIFQEVWSIALDQKGQFWIGTTEGLSRFDGKKFSDFPIPKASVKDTNTVFAYDRITSILEDKNGDLWFGTDGFGITKYHPSTKEFTLFTKEDGLCDNNIYDLFQDSKGNIWIGTMFGGLSMYNGHTFTNFTQLGMIEGIEVGGIHEDNYGNIWFASENVGVYRYDGHTFTKYNEADGLNTGGILAIYQDREGRFWLGGWGGLFRYNGSSFYNVTKDGPWK